MTNPILALVEKYAGPRFVQQATGILEDFWKDTPCEFPKIEINLAGRTFKLPNILKPVPLASHPDVTPKAASRQPIKVAAEIPLWRALPGELAEKMWGAEQVLPAGDAVMKMLIAPLALTKDKNVIDLSAGLGGQMRKLVGQVSQLKGFETNAALAARGMEISVKEGKGKQASIETLEPGSFSIPAIYDCMIARELFYHVADKAKFFYSIAAGIKPQGHAVFTDYIVDAENRGKPGIVAWQAHEPAAKPLALIDMAEAWALVGFELRVSDDQTAFYRHEIAAGINRFVAALRHAPTANAETKKAILAEVETWIHRLAAIQQGMKFYRFHAVKT